MDRYTPQENVKYVKKKTNKIECEKNGVETRITKSTRATTSSCCYGNWNKHGKKTDRHRQK